MNAFFQEFLFGPDGAQFVAAMGGRDAEARERYRALLAEQDDERAEMFAIEDALAREDFAERDAAIARAQAILAKSERVRAWWSFVSRTAPIRNCGSAGAVRTQVRFAFECPMTWASLAPTDDPSARHCSTCDRLVYLCRSRDEAEERARAGHCITVSASDWNAISSDLTSACTGRPDPIAMWAERVFPRDGRDE